MIGLPPYTDDELAEIKRHFHLTVADWERMTPEQRRADIAEFWGELDALGGNINRLDPNDPAWLKPEHDEQDWNDGSRRSKTDY